MKRTLLAIALSVAAAGYAGAQEYDDQVLAPVIVEHVDVDRLLENCTPPASAPGCAGFHAMIRQHFSEREIGMLFGAATSYPEYRTSYTAVRERYDAMLRYIADNGVPVVTTYDEPVTVVRPATPAVYQDVSYGPVQIQRRAVYDDPDAETLHLRAAAAPDVDDDEDDDTVIYYDDDDSLPPPPRRQ